MRCHWTAVMLATALMLSISPFASAQVSDPGAPGYANNMLGGFVTPTVAPGMEVQFSFNLSNPYDDPSAWMINLTLTVGIYRYVTQDETRDVNGSFSHAPHFSGNGTEVAVALNPIQPGLTIRINLSILTSTHTPHGSYFSQSTYFVRFGLSFSFPANSSVVALKSRGFFTDDQWNAMVSFEGGQSMVNRTYMKSLGVDGLLPDSSFGLKAPIPRWPLGVILGAAGLLSFMAVYYYTMENPGTFPRLEKRFYYLRGKLSQLRSQLKNRRGK